MDTSVPDSARRLSKAARHVASSGDNSRLASVSDLHLIIDSAPALIHTAQPDGHIDFFNRTWLEYVGLRLEDFLGWKWTAAIHPDDLDGILEKWRASLATGGWFLPENRLPPAGRSYLRMLPQKV